MLFNVHVSSHLFTLGLENQLDKIKIKFDNCSMSIILNLQHAEHWVSHEH